MPVLDHPIHDKVKHDKPPAGCFNRESLKDGYFAKSHLIINRYHEAVYQMVYVHHVMSTKCRQINDLPECEGCTAEKDVEYIERMKQL